jgi:hypothetical protein
LVRRDNTVESSEPREFVTDLTVEECLERLRMFRRLGSGWPPGIRQLARGRYDGQGFLFSMTASRGIWVIDAFGPLVRGSFQQSASGTVISLTYRLDPLARATNALGCAGIPVMFVAFAVYRFLQGRENVLVTLAGAVGLVAIAVLALVVSDRVSLRALRANLDSDPFPLLLQEAFDATERSARRTRITRAAHGPVRNPRHKGRGHTSG